MIPYIEVVSPADNRVKSEHTKSKDNTPFFQTEELGKSQTSHSNASIVESPPDFQNLQRNDGWTEQEEDKLFQLHNIHGNRWAKISHFLPGKSDNCIKNHFYCTLRKAFRRINRFISENKNKVRQKEIKNMVLSKIITVAEQRFETKLEVNEEMISTCGKIKNNLVRFSKDLSISEATEANLLIIIADINQFSRSFKKRKAKKLRKQFPTTVDNLNEQLKPETIKKQIRGETVEIGQEGAQLNRIDIGKSVDFNIEDIGYEDNGLLYNFEQKSPMHMMSFDMPSPQADMGAIDNPFAAIQDNVNAIYQRSRTVQNQEHYLNLR